MGARHYSFDELDAYAMDPNSVPDRAEIEAHLAACDECTDALAVGRAFIAGLSSEEVWHHAEDLVMRERQRPLVDLAARIKREDEIAARLLRGPLKSPLAFLYANTAHKSRYRSGGVVRLLCVESKRVREQDPMHARNLADVAALIAHALPDDYYPARGVNHLRGLAHKEFANALRYLGELPAAHDELDRAARTYRELPSHDLELAIIDYVRATVFWKQQRFDDALEANQRCAATFSRFADHERWFNARMLEGAILCDAHNGAAAVLVFADLLSAHDAASDLTTAARLENNLARSYLETDDLGEAVQHFLVALRLFEVLEIPTEVARVRWSLGSVALAGGNAVEAERRFRHSEAEFDRLHLRIDAALVRLDLIEALLVQERYTEVVSLSAELPNLFNTAGMVPAALTAASFVHEAAFKRTLSAVQVRYVRRFVVQADENRALIFTPPRE